MERGLDLLDIFTGKLSFRRLRIVLDNLPPESAFRTALRDSMSPEDLAAASAEADVADSVSHGPWSLSDQLLASVADSLAVLVWAKGDEKKRGKPPKPIPRPGVDSGRRTVKPHVVEKLQGIRARHAARQSGDLTSE